MQVSPHLLVDVQSILVKLEHGVVLDLWLCKYRSVLDNSYILGLPYHILPSCAGTHYTPWTTGAVSRMGRCFPFFEAAKGEMASRLQRWPSFADRDSPGVPRLG